MRYVAGMGSRSMTPGAFRSYGLDVDIIDADAPQRWDDQVDECLAHDAFHHWAYVTSVARGEVLLFVVRAGPESWVLPLELERIDVGELRDVVTARSPYGYSGPVWTAGWRPEATATAWLAVREALESLNVVTVLLRLHPSLPSTPTLPDGALSRQEGDVVILPLHDDDEAYWRQMRGGHRKNLRRASREGLVCAVDESPGAVSAFHAVYEQTMRRLDARGEYLFGVEVFRRLHSTQAFGAMIMAVDYKDSRLASGVFLHHGEHSHYFLSGSMPDRRFGSRPTRLMIHHARSLLRDRGCTYMNLGGGVGAKRDALFEFKAEFSAQRATFNTVRWVVNADAYEKVCSARGVQPAPTPAQGWFPAFLDPKIGVEAGVEDPRR